MDNVARQLEIENKRQRLRDIGIAKFTINGMDEDESIAQLLDEKFTFSFALVRSMPGRNNKLHSWRLFSLSKKKPMLPMGYWGMPGFTFECYDGTPEKTSQEILLRMMEGVYTFSKREFDSFAMKKVEGKTNPLFFKINEESKKYLENHAVKMLRWQDAGK